MLTYAFDLLYAIYEEEGYAPSEIPGLILTHNLYGTEIDQRAGSLAAFALTMKARSKKRTFFSKPVQPNICVLKPISFTPDELKNLATKDGDLFAESEYWNQFTHADLFGSLIHPDPELTQVLKAHLATLDDGGKLGSFCIGIDPLGSDLFEQELLERARTVIAQAEYLSESYHIAIANPPYMGSKQMNSLLSQFMKQEYPTGKADLMTAFMARAQTLIPRYGIWAMINLPSWMSLKSFEDLRQDLLRNQTISSMVHLGRGIFGSDFGTVAFVINNAPPKSVRGVYRRLFEQHVEVRSVAAIETLFHDSAYNRYEICQTDFAEIPGSPIVYWLSEKMRATFKSGRPLSEVANLRQGLATGENNRFLRLWWEVAQNRSQYCATSIETAHSTECKWFPYNKGGEFRKWYGNQEYVIAFDSDNYAILSRQGNHLPSRQYYFSPSVSWSDVSSGSPSFRCFPAGFIHGNKGNSIFGDEVCLEKLSVILNSVFATFILEGLAPTMTSTIGDVAKFPILNERLIDGQFSSRQLVAGSKVDWNSLETAWDYECNPLVVLAKQ